MNFAPCIFRIMLTMSTPVNAASTYSILHQHCHLKLIPCLRTCVSLSAASTQSTQATCVIKALKNKLGYILRLG